jgi:hypothetical protein
MGDGKRMQSGAEWPKLTASELVAAAWAFFKNNLGSLVTAAAFPVVLSLLIGVGSLLAAQNESVPGFAMAVQPLLELLPWTLFGVAWHRFVLLGEQPAMSITWSSDHTRFALFLAAWRMVWLLILSPEAVEEGSEPSVLFSLLKLVAVVVLAYGQARLSLFLPATAVERRISPSEAWTKSTGYGGTLFWSGFLAGMLAGLICIPLLAVILLNQQQSVDAIQLVLIPIGSVAQLVFEALMVGTLSFAYKAIEFRASRNPHDAAALTGAENR